MLSIQNLTKTYKTGDRALTDVSFDLPKGQVLGLIGPSGAGKATLIRCLSRLVGPTSGRVMLTDLDVTGLNARDLQRAPPHRDDLSGIRTGRTPDRDGERAVGALALCLVLAR